MTTGSYRRKKNPSIITVLMDPMVNVPDAYAQEAIKKDSKAVTLATCTANKIYEIDLTCIDGTNQAALLEISVWKNDYSAPTGTNPDFAVSLYRENGTNGGDPTVGALRDSAQSIGGVARIVCPILDWSTTEAQLVFSITGTYQVSARAFYYTPAV